MNCQFMLKTGYGQPHSRIHFVSELKFPLKLPIRFGGRPAQAAF